MGRRDGRAPVEATGTAGYAVRSFFRARGVIVSVSVDPQFGSANAATGLPTSHGVVAAWRASLRDVAIACLLAALVLAPTAFELAASWQTNEAYQYAWLVGPMFVYVLGWHQRAQLREVLPQPDLAGVVVAIVAAIGWSVATAANIDIGRQLALVMMLQAIALAALGRALYGRLLPLMAFLFLLLPSADLLLDPLRQVTTRSIDAFAWASGLPRSVDGYSIHIGENTYYVLEACSGLGPVTLTLFLGYCYGLLVFDSFLKTLGLALFGASLGVLANVIRVCAIVWLDWTRGYAMDLAAHVRIQWLAVLIVMALLFYALQRIHGDGTLRRLPAALAARPPASVLRRHAPIVAGAVILAITGVASAMLRSDSGPSAAASTALPRIVVPGWELITPHAGWAARGDLSVLALDYRDKGRRLGVTLVETRVDGAKLPLPGSLMENAQAAWRDIIRQPVDACNDAYCVRLVHEIWLEGSGEARRHVYYAYSLGAFHTVGTLFLRLAVALSRLSGHAEPARLLAVSFDGVAPGLPELATIYRVIDDALRDAATWPG